MPTMRQIFNQAIDHCPHFVSLGIHDWRVEPNQVIRGDAEVEVKVVCAECMAHKVMRVKRQYSVVNPNDPKTWRKWRV